MLRLRRHYPYATPPPRQRLLGSQAVSHPSGTMRWVSASPSPSGFGTGIYSFSEAARILALRSSVVRAGTLRRWVSSGLTPPSFGQAEAGGSLLSLHDLVSLDVVRRFRECGVSLQRLRKLEVGLRDLLLDIPRPFAHRIFFTNGADVWVQLGESDDVIELVGRRPGQYVWCPAIQTLAKEIRFGPRDEAIAWELSEHIEIDPAVQFGDPVVKGTRLPISAIKAELDASHSVEEIADWHAIDVEDVRGVQLFLAA